MTRTRTVVLLALSIHCTNVFAMQQHPNQAAAWSDVQQYWRHTAEAMGVVGSSIAIVQDGHVVYADHYGQADRETGRLIDDRTIFHWASITKTFTGIAIMQLRDHGMLELDDPVVKYVPEFSRVHSTFGDPGSVTIRHLMSHSSGLRNPTWPWGGGQPWHPHEPTEWAQLVAMFPYTELLFEPGSRYSYSNPGVILLGRVIEVLTGDDYEVYMDKNVLRPLEMRWSYFDHTPYHLLPYRSNNYYITEGVLEANGLDFDTGITVSNGGLNAPIPDMVRYLSFLSGHLEGAVAPDGTGSVPVLSRTSLEEMWQIEQPVSIDDDGTWSMGLSFYLWDEAGERVVGHTGSQQGYRSFFYVNPRTGTAALVAFNTIAHVRQPDGSLADDDSGFFELRRRILRKLFPAMAAR